MVDLQTITLAIQATAALFVVGGALFELGMRLAGRKGPLMSLLRMNKQHEHLQETVECVEGKVDDIDKKVETVENTTLLLAHAHNEDEDVPMDRILERYERDDDLRSFLWSDD